MQVYRMALGAAVLGLALAGTAAGQEQIGPGMAANAGGAARSMWQARLVGVDPGADVTGTAIVTESGRSFEIGLLVHGASSSTRHQWHVRAGTCAAPAEDSGRDFYPPLITDAKGAGRVRWLFPGPLRAEQQYHVRVSTEDGPAQGVACGDLRWIEIG